MKKQSMIAIAAAAALMLSGSFATAGEYVDIEQNPSGGTTPRGVAATPSPADLASFLLNSGAVEDIDQNDNGPRGGGGRFRTLVKPRNREDVGDDKQGRFVGEICLVNPIAGQLICWGG